TASGTGPIAATGRKPSRIASPEDETVSPADLPERSDRLEVLDRGDLGNQVDGPIDRPPDQHVVLWLGLGSARVEPVREAAIAPGEQIAALAPPRLVELHRCALRVRLDLAGEARERQRHEHAGSYEEDDGALCEGAPRVEQVRGAQDTEE